MMRMNFNKGEYTAPNCSLKMTVIKIQYSNLEYVKFKGILSNKMNGIIHETKNYKLYWEKISHWEKVFG